MEASYVTDELRITACVSGSLSWHLVDFIDYSSAVRMFIESWIA